MGVPELRDLLRAMEERPSWKRSRRTSLAPRWARSHTALPPPLMVSRRYLMPRASWAFFGARKLNQETNTCGSANWPTAGSFSGGQVRAALMEAILCRPWTTMGRANFPPFEPLAESIMALKKKKAMWRMLGKNRQAHLIRRRGRRLTERMRGSQGPSHVNSRQVAARMVLI